MTYSSEVLADAPLAYYRLGEASGTQMVDSSSYARTGAFYSGSATRGPGLLVGDSDTAVVFSGPNPVGAAPSATWMDVASLTVEALVRPTDVTGYHFIVSREANGTLGTFWVTIRDGHFELLLHPAAGGTVTFTSNAAAVIGGTYHIALTVDGTNARFYVNGLLDKTVACGPLGSTVGRDLRIGLWEGGLPFAGTIDEVSYYGTALSATRVAAHYAATLLSSYSGQVLADAPAAYWRLGESTAAGGAADASGHGKTGTYTNAPTLGQPSLAGDTDTSAKFNGTANAIDTPTIPRAASGFVTVEALVKLNALNKTQYVYVRSNENPAVGTQIKLFRLLVSSANHAEFHVYNGNGWAVVAGSTTLTTGAVYHLAGRLDGANLKVYVNGVLDGTLAYTGTLVTQDPGGLIGAGFNGALYGFFDGWIDEVAEHAAALSDARIAARYAMIRPAVAYSREVLADAPWGYWRLTQAPGLSAWLDASGNNRTLSVTGATQITGPRGSAATFPDGGEAHSDASFTRPTLGTYEVWVRASAAPAAETPLMGFSPTGGGNGIAPRLALATSGKVQFEVYTGTANLDYFAVSPNSIADGQWHHVVGSVGSAAMKLYVDGALVATNTPTAGLNIGDSTLFMLHRGNMMTNSAPLDLAEPAFYSAQLSDARVAAHYAGTFPTGYSAEVFADSPLGYYRLDDLPSPVVLTDSSGNARHGTYVGTATSVAGLVAGDADKALNFSNGRGIVASASWMQTTNWSMVATIKPTGVSGTQTILARYDSVSVANSAWVFRLDSTTLSLYPFVGNTFAALTSTTAFVAGQTYDVAATYDGTTARLYVNGVLEASGARTTSNNVSSAVPLTIGATSAGVETFGGVIDDVSYFGTALPGTTVSALASARTSSGYSAAVLAQGPLAYYRLADASSVAAPANGPVVDSSGNGRYGAYQAYPAIAAGLLVGDASGAGDFTGSSWASIGYAAWMAPATLTVEAVIQPDAPSITGEHAFMARHTQGSAQWDFAVNDGKLRFRSAVNGFVSVAGATTLVAGTTYHVAATYNNTTGATTLYLNGVVDGSGTVSPNASVAGTNLTLGSTGHPTVFFDGRLDELAMYGTILSPTRIAAHAAAAAAAQTSYAQLILADAPLGFYRFGEVSSITAVDSSGNGRNGSYGAAPTRPVSLVGESGDTAFDLGAGVNWASVPDATWMNVGTATVEAWIKPSAIGAEMVIAQRDNENVNRDFQLQVNSAGKPRFGIWLSTGAFMDCVGATTLVAGTTYHVAGTYDGTTIRVYLNGVQDAAVAASGTMRAGSGVNLDIGRHIYNGAQVAFPFKGILDEVAYYGTALSQTRLAAHYARTASPTTGLAGTLPSPTAALTGTVAVPVITGTVSGTVSSPTAALSGTVVPPVTGTLTGTLPSPTAALTGSLPPTGTLAATVPALTASLAGTVVAPDVDHADVLSGTGGSFTVNFGITPSRVVTFTPTFAGSLVMQAAGGWQATYTVVDSDGDDVQDDTGTLGAVWVGGELMSLTIAPVAGQPLVPVTFTWSYAARASSPLSISMDNYEVTETPGGVSIDVYNGQPSDTLTLSILGPTAIADFQTAKLDTFGVREDLMVRLPALAAGDYFLRVEGDASGSEDTPFTVLEDALAQGDVIRLDDTAPPRDPALHWRLFDLRDHAVNYTFVRNPSSWTNVYPPNDFTHDKTTAPDGQPLTWQAAARPWRMEFTGWLDTEAEYNDLLFWSQLRRRLWLVDHRNRAWLITIEQFDAQAQVKSNLPWAHKYTVKTLVFMQGT